MFLLGVSIIDHPGVGDLEIDFRDDDGLPSPVIIIAGENGVGKSAVFEAVYSVLRGDLADQDIGKVTLKIEFNEAQLQAIEYVYGRRLTANCEIYRDSSKTSSWEDAYRLRGVDETSGDFVDWSWPAHDSRLREGFRALYNEAGVDYFSGSPESITGLTLDTSSTTAKSSRGVAQQIAQLMVDIRNADSEDVHVWVESNPGQAVPIDVTDKRFSRFRAAFNYMFPNKKFRSIRRTEGGMRVEFEDGGRISTLDQLSTGEKQIVFRGGFLLRDQNKLANSVILIDEPELSLHPKWQSRIVGFYREIVKQRDGSSPQIIVATHSPFIVHGVPDARVVILEKDPETAVTSQSAHPTYPVSHESLAVRVFGLTKFLAAAEARTIVLTEGVSDANLIQLAWEKLRPNRDIPFQLRAALGAGTISKTLNDDQLPSKLGDHQIVGIFDYDNEGFSQWKGSMKNSTETSSDEEGRLKKHNDLAAWAMLLPVPVFRAALANKSLAQRSMMAIEMLFTDQSIPSSMKSIETIAGGAQIPYIPNGRKTAFAEYAGSLTPQEFENFEPLIAALESIAG